jgi:Flp pilus assembly protein TadD
MRGHFSHAAALLFLSLVSVACVRQQRVASPFAGQVNNAVDAGQGNLAMRELRRRLAADATDFDARMQIAKLYSQKGLPDLALEHYRLAAAQFPDSEVAALELAKTLREMEASGEALRAAQEFLTRHPHGSWELLSLKGILEDEQGRFSEAEAAYREALTLAPGRGAIHNNLGYNLLLQGRPADAADEFRRAIALDPKSEIAHNNLGVALASQKSFIAAEALSEWQRSSGPAAAHNNLAAVLMEQGRDAEARAELTAAIGFQRDFPEALANLKLLSERNGQPVTVPAIPPRRRPIWARVFGKRNSRPVQTETKDSSAGIGSTAVANSVETRPDPVDAGGKQ